MSVDFCDARQGGGAYGKTPAAWPSSCPWSFAHMSFPALSPDSVDNPFSFLSVSTPLAAAERPSVASQ
ncbi:hypothetical protein FIA77_24445 [Escherichia coli]|nr:hypothetical protein [Escherichia coli]MXE98967.1 hypothetical protein [Escherichia coli]TJR31923.1 hypothetical protein C9Z42_25465 [Escherichia coli]